MITAIIALALGLLLVIFIYFFEKKLIAIRNKEVLDRIDDLHRLQNSMISEIHNLKDSIADPLIQSLTNDIIDFSNQMGHIFEKLDQIENQLQSHKDAERNVSSGNKKTRTPEQKARMSQIAKERWLRRKQPYLLTMQAAEMPAKSS